MELIEVYKVTYCPEDSDIEFPPEYFDTREEVDKYIRGQYGYRVKKANGSISLSRRPT
uniref:Uncharacterized protein n=1 Tax=viral metagenome TaxID=1070528 RepID=A0A6C0J285_9ZZZZ